MNYTFKKSVTGGALALLLLSSTPTAEAQSPSGADLQAQIASLLATIQTLQAQIAGTTIPQPNSLLSGYTWTRSLTVGATGEDVRKLQQLLNSDPDTRVAVSGAGAPGMETTFFGGATAAAVSKFQVKYRSEILTPSGLVNPTGFFGPSSLAKANALTRVVVTPPILPNPVTPTPNPEPTNPVSTLTGEGTLARFEIDRAANTKINEAAADAIIAELTLEAKDGDIELTRMDLALVADSGNTEKDPWDTFETISLWTDGEKIAERHIDTRSNFLNRNLGTIRLSDLGLILEDDEPLELLVAVSVKNNIRGAGTNSNWSISAERIRYFDADQVATDDNATDEIGDKTTFSIVERGEGEELKFSVSPNNPTAQNIIVDTSRRTNNQTILEYTIEAIDADIELDTLYVAVQTGTASYTDVVSDIRLEIGSRTFRRDTTLQTGLYSATNTRVSFDIDGRITVDEDEKERVRVIVDLKPQTSYTNGETIQASITSTERDLTQAEGSDDIRKFSGTVVGKQHRLVSEGLVSSAERVRFSATTQGTNDTTGIFTATFEVTAIEGDFYLTEYASTSISSTTGGVQYSVDTTVGVPTTISASLSSSADENTPGVFTIREGESETVTLTVVVDASAAGQHRILLEQILFSPETDGVTNSSLYRLVPTNEFRSPFTFINQ